MKKFDKDLFDKSTFKELCIPGAIGFISLFVIIIFDLGPVMVFLSGCVIGLFLSSLIILIKDCFR